jgi:hypothetical protein
MRRVTALTATQSRRSSLERLRDLSVPPTANGSSWDAGQARDLAVIEPLLMERQDSPNLLDRPHTERVQRRSVGGAAFQARSLHDEGICHRFGTP